MVEQVVSPEGAAKTKTVLSVDSLPIQSTFSGEDRRILVDHDVTKDEAAILGLGYKQEFKRDFNLLAVLSVSFSVLGLLPSVASTQWYSTCYTGAAGLTWAYLIGLIGVITVGLSMSEIASAFPTSGGLYYATAALAPKKHKAFLSWCVGWSNYLIQLTGGPANGWSVATLIQAMVTLAKPDYVTTTWKTYLICIACTFTCACIASLPTRWLARVETFTASLNFIFLFVSFVIILGANTRSSQGISKFNSNSDAWGITNFTDWPDGFAILMSFLSVIWMMSGFDSPFHIAEEASNAQTAVPWAITLTVIIGGVLGFVFQLAMSYTVVDITLVAESDIGQPYITFLQQILTDKRVYALGSFATVLTFVMCFSSMISASRVLFSYSRDNCFPLSHIWSTMNKVTGTPVNAVWCNWCIGVLLDLLIFAGSTAISALFAIGASGAFISFTVPTLLRITCGRKTFKHGPWNLGKLSIPCGTTACLFVALMLPVLCFPAYKGADLTLDLMNWTVVVYYGSMVLVISYWFIYGHKIYHGPVSNLDKDTVISGADADKIVKEVESLNPDVKTGPTTDEDEKISH